MKFEVVGIDMVDLNEVEKPEIVYKYRSWNQGIPSHDRVLTGNQLFMAQPSSFEDEFDCKIPERFDLMSDIEEREWITRFFQREHPRYNSQAISRMVDEQARKIPFKDAERMSEFNKWEWDTYNSMTGVLSLCTQALSSEMWSYYGENGKGICYGFHLSTLIESSPGLMGGYVQYVEDLPIISPLYDLMYKAFLRVMCKLQKWGFEEEYRLRSFHESNTTAQNRVITYPPEALMEVILGREFDDNEVEVIIQHLKNMGSIARLYKCIEINNVLLRNEIEY